ncbi:hypothetical protein [Brucella anthropi]|uniref:hypothetical protein n=1 Tax=Brucella anthropi TaxID=529 RepID=UPI000F68D0B2|nr:hypothetical protein [Brucella anthropi]RRY08830.1 hypothetical protein EGJ58_13095 [Brucella anthropi]
MINSRQIFPPIKWKQTSERVWDAVIAEGWKARVVHALGDDTWSYVVNHSGRCFLSSKEDAMRQAEDNAKDRIWSEIIAARKTIAAFPNAFESALTGGGRTSFDDAAKWHDEEAKRLEGVETFNKRIRHKLAFHQICAAQFRAMKNSSPQEFPYNRTFNAIAAATRVEGGNVAISVHKFVKAFGGSVVEDQTPTAGPVESSDQSPEWIWYGEDDDGNSRVSTGRWAKHSCQKRYKLAEIQATEHDHKRPTPAATDTGLDYYTAADVMWSLEGNNPAPSKNGQWVKRTQADELFAENAELKKDRRFKQHVIDGLAVDKESLKADNLAKGAEVERMRGVFQRMTEQFAIDPNHSITIRSMVYDGLHGVANIQSAADFQAWKELRELTFAIQHNPNCPDKFLIRLPGRSGRIDLKPYADQLGFRKSETEDVIGFGKTLAEALATALKHQEGGNDNGE